VSITFSKANLTDKTINLANFNRLIEYVGRLANMSVDQNMTLINDPTGYKLGIRPSSISSMDYSDFAFGFSCSEDVVTVNPGYVFHGTRNAIAVATKTEVEIAADNTYIYVSCTFGSGAASVASSTTFPQHTTTGINWLLYKVTLTGGVASVEEGDIHHLGSITIPGSFA
jgi:hypothetical protein